MNGRRVHARERRRPGREAHEKAEEEGLIYGGSKARHAQDGKILRRGIFDCAANGRRLGPGTFTPRPGCAVCQVPAILNFHGSPVFKMDDKQNASARRRHLQHRRVPRRHLGVEVRVPESEPTTVSGLTDRASAQRWITRHQDRVAAGPLERLPFRKRVPPKAP